MPNSGSLTNGIGQSGDPGVPDRLIEDNGILFAPRFGLTYDITGNQSFIFRAGGGVFYDRYEGNISFALISNPPTTFTPRDQLRPAAGDRSGDGAAGPVGPQRAGGHGPGADDLQLQRRLPEEAAGRRDLGHRLRRLARQPPAAPGERQRGALRRAVPAAEPGPDAAGEHRARPERLRRQLPAALPGYGNINLRLYDANSNYHGLQTQVDRRFSNGLFLNANYTFSKALDTQDVNTDFSRIDGFDKQANYGPAAFDRRHIFNFNWVYQLPKNEGVNAFVSGIINNWQVSGGYRLESGTPYGLTWSVNGISTTSNIAGSNTENANRPIINGDTGAGYDVDNPYQQVALGIYEQSPVGSIGLESGRNYLNRAPVNNVDLSVEKGFGLGSRRRLAFRVDAFNALNHTQFDAVANNIQFQALGNNTIVNLPYDAAGTLVRTNGFGAVTSVRSPRVAAAAGPVRVLTGHIAGPGVRRWTALVQ